MTVIGVGIDTQVLKSESDIKPGNVMADNLAQEPAKADSEDSVILSDEAKALQAGETDTTTNDEGDSGEASKAVSGGKQPPPP